MIDSAIKHLAAQLDQFLKSTLSTSENIVVVSNLVDSAGNPIADVNNKVAMFLCGLERDTVAMRAGDGNTGRSFASGAPVFLNLYVMVAANFGGATYPEALRFLSAAIGFFQRQPVFDRVSTPDLDPGIERLVLDMENLKPHESSNIWSLLGAKYIPSVLYRVRMVSIDGVAIRGRQPAIVDPTAAIASNSEN